MDIDIKIGKEVEGNNILIVPSNCKLVSRKHATLSWHDGVATIEDNESTNGTYVNGKRVAKSKVTENDIVWLGGKGGDECFQLDMKKIFDSCRNAEKKARTDYTKEFEDLKRVYMDYQAEVAELKKKTTQSSQLPKMLASLIPAVAGLIFFLATLGSDNPQMGNIRIGIMLSGTAISGVVGVLTMGKNNAISEKMNEEITEIQIKYQKKYCCPKCGMKYPFTTHWKKLEAEGKCPNPKCDAQFVKQ